MFKKALNRLPTLTLILLRDDTLDTKLAQITTHTLRISQLASTPSGDQIYNLNNRCIKMEEEYIMDSQLGQVRINYNNKGITRVKFTKEVVETSTKDKPNENVEIAVKWLEAYFKDPTETKSMDFPILDTEAHHGKEFMCKVWNVLKDQVGPGQTISYGELAKLCGSPKAARAVGQAMKTNPFSIVVPCHRVITSSGAMGNYGGGVDKKRWLLKHEGKEFDLK